MLVLLIEGCTIAGAGIITDRESIGLNIKKMVNQEKCTKAKTLQELITEYESKRIEFYNSMHQIADLIEKQLISRIQANEDVMFHEYQIKVFYRLRKI